ncbi:protein ALP1-like [Neodiprion fabricii]|uniref:protein ALP1-like n=1 Tax=Neodiprion fabricii TaxID=2872261 RepID=UPI001ED942D4|nr:protein ALP1-like [Neodiprion fabricii]
MTLWFLGNRESHRLLSNLFDISFSSVFHIVRRVIDWLITLVPQFIKWLEGNNLVRISERFENVAGIRGCIDAIDGSHIHINKLEGNGRVYFNRKQHYSILLQAVVDCDLKFTNVYCGDPGSFHDAKMLRRSDLFVVAEQNRERIFPNNSFLLGDKGYNGVAQTWLVCPFRNNRNLTVEEDEFDTKISQTRVVVELAFGIHKGRFRLLQMMSLRDI